MNATLIVPGKFYRICDSKDARILEIILQELVNSSIINFKRTSHLVFYGYGKEGSEVFQNRFIFENIHSEEKRVAHLFFCDYEATLDVLRNQEEIDIWEKLTKIGLIGIGFGLISYLKLKN